MTQSMILSSVALDAYVPPLAPLVVLLFLGAGFVVFCCGIGAAIAAAARRRLLAQRLAAGAMGAAVVYGVLLLGASLLSRERTRRFCSHVRRLRLSSELMTPGSKEEDIRQTEGMREFLGHGQRLLALLERLVWIPQQPEWAHHIGEDKHAKIHAKAQDQRAVLLGIIEGETLLEVRLGRG